LRSAAAPLQPPIQILENYPLTDSSRARELPLKIYYPAEPAAGGYPVIIFSHGSGGSKDGYSYLGRYWAEHGYVAIHVTHLEFSRIRIRDGQILVSGSWVPMPEAAKEELSSDNREEWMVKNRAMDVSFIIDSLPAIQKGAPELAGRMDLSRIGVAGHSEGASTVMATAGAVLEFPAWRIRAYGDPRIKAFIAMGPWTPGEGGFSTSSWASVTRPMLTMAGSKERTNGGTSRDPMLQIIAHMPPAGKFHITVTDANHNDFADEGFGGPEIHAFIEHASLAFWDIALRGNDPSSANFVQELAAEGLTENAGHLSGVGARGELRSAQ
jgi:predicted dienelactone hydrolase